MSLKKYVVYKRFSVVYIKILCIKRRNILKKITSGSSSALTVCLPSTEKGL